MGHCLILGHLDCRNKGNEAVLLGLIQGIHSIYPSIKIYIPSDDPSYDAHYFSTYKNRIVFSKYWQSPFFFSRIINKIKNYYKTLIKLGNINEYSLFTDAYGSLIRRAEFVIFSGKDLFTEDYGQDSLNNWISQLAIACDLNNKVYLWGISLGPFSKENEKKVSRIIEKLCCITAREIASYRYIKKISDLPECHLIPDPAFIIPTEKPTHFQLQKKKENYIRLGFSISGGLIKYRGLDRSTYLNIFKTTILKLNSCCNIEVIFIPHVVDSGGNDDYDVSNIIKKELKEKDFATILAPKNMRTTEYKYIIETCDCFIGTRTHPTIASLSLNVPTIFIAYSIKSYGICEEFFGDLRWLIDIQDLTVNSLTRLVKNLIKNRDNVRIITSKKAIKIKEAVSDGWLLLKK